MLIDLVQLLLGHFVRRVIVQEAARIVKVDGVVAFTDWVEGPAGLSEEEKNRFCTFMKFPDVQSISGYSDLLAENGLEIEVAEDTEQFAAHVDLYLNMLNMQLTYDALKIIGFDQELMGAMAGEMMFLKVQRIPDNGMVDSYSIPREQLCEMFYKPNTN